MLVAGHRGAQPLSARSKKHSTRCYTSGGGGGVVVKFNIPYRCEFGQHMRLIGTGEKLGEWDLRRAVPMEWSEGDVWTVELKLPAAGGPLELAYKYVVVGGDGEGSAWKPGDNFVLTMPAARSASVTVRDAWDETSREVQIEVVKAAAVATRRRRKAGASGEDAAAAPDEALEAIAAAADLALDQLDAAVSMSGELLEGAQDPASPDLLAADRLVAAAAQRAAALGKALDAAASPRLLTDRRPGA